MTRWAMVVEQDRCIGCWACAIACKVENSVSLDLWWQRVLTVDGVVTPTSDLGLDGPVADISTATNPVKTYLPVQCQHCERPDCAAACPTDAITRRADGIVVIDEAACIGCGYCTVACPYDAISLNDGPPRFPSGLEAGHGSAAVAPRSSGVAEKCTFCVHRVDVGVEPACVEACPTQVLFFGDLDDPTSEVAKRSETHDAHQLKADLGLAPRVRYRPATTAVTQRRSLARPDR